ncbi:amidohydrolase family protein [Sphingomonas carotinifaciens]|uniref:Amidohydrolase family protein n=1 Tax=Sphingomonas carotinifaciens TaxID=1166323 RepID=A0A1G7HWP0_9SPHN|nr:amidohydrolase family protein [Sphingomonas carotinifaciens]MBB4085093.1 putative TIM-barrel fold metal-dependent hydrolase [Sphingomonas carotinifaciens]MWC44471.1 amidohydrolase family protein [Sphingomonas carotinifaciens]SDF04763.1 Predicted metal-dependent hydrolase, TIM-barrel fold [Sphingomonas carotinifaciens]
MTVPFLDAHIHLWDLSRLRYPWLTPPFAEDGPNGSVAAIAQDFGAADYRAALARWQVVGAVHVDAGADPGDALAETAWLEEVAGASGLPDAIVAFAALDDPAIDGHLAAQARHPRVRGIRHIVNWHPDAGRSYTPRDLTRDDGWRAGFRKLADHGLSFDLQCYPDQMAGLVPLFADNPRVPVIVNHLGMPVLFDPDGIATWRAGLAALATLPQVSIKLSGLGFIARDWTQEQVRPFVRHAIDLFGTQRCMVASDAPTDMLFAPIDRYMDALHAILSDFGDGERRDLFGRNANRIYRVGLAL